MTWILSLPLAIPFVTAVLAFLWRTHPAGRWISIAGSVALLVMAIVLVATVWREGVIAAQMGGWPAPFGITLVADLLSAVMVLITGIVAVAISIYALADVDAEMERLGYHALFNVLIAGVVG
ncbi:MAG: Na+/H+ antiporter subunit D, partial [Pseudomonadota bacterium]